MFSILNSWSIVHFLWGPLNVCLGVRSLIIFSSSIDVVWIRSGYRTSKWWMRWDISKVVAWSLLLCYQIAGHLCINHQPRKPSRCSLAISDFELFVKLSRLVRHTEISDWQLIICTDVSFWSIPLWYGNLMLDDQIWFESTLIIEEKLKWNNKLR